MTRLRRLLLHTATALSLLLALAALALWLRSYRTSDMLWYGQPSWRLGLITEPGVIRAFRDRNRPRRPDPDTFWYTHWPATPGARYRPEFYETAHWNHWGFSFVTDRQDDGFLRSWTFSLPYWFLLLTLCTIPTTRLVLHRRRRRHRQALAAHLCPTCDYDLRATPHRCPECGATPTAR